MNNIIKAFNAQRDRLGACGIIVEEDGDVYKASGSAVEDNYTLLTKDGLISVVLSLSAVKKISGNSESCGFFIWNVIQRNLHNDDAVKFRDFHWNLPRIAKSLAETDEKNGLVSYDDGGVCPPETLVVLNGYALEFVGRKATQREKDIFYKSYRGALSRG